MCIPFTSLYSLVLVERKDLKWFCSLVTQKVIADVIDHAVRLAPEETSVKLTGYEHNAVTCVGMNTDIPVIIFLFNSVTGFWPNGSYTFFAYNIPQRVQTSLFVFLEYYASVIIDKWIVEMLNFKIASDEKGKLIIYNYFIKLTNSIFLLCHANVWNMYSKGRKKYTTHVTLYSNT